MKRNIVSRRFVTTLAIVVLAMTVVPALAFAQNPNPGILPPTSAPYGKTYGEWSAAHWQWLYSLPIDHHPLFDTADCSAGQSGEVWFLGGTFTLVTVNGGAVGIATRNCNVPAGKALFFPIIDGECATLEGNPPPGTDLSSCAKFFQDHAHDLTATIDGLPVKNLDGYRVQSPLFTYGPLPDNNILQFFGLNAPAGSTSPSVSDGVFLMLRPLSKGKHTIHFTGAVTFIQANGDPFDFDFRLDITYHLTVG